MQRTANRKMKRINEKSKIRILIVEDDVIIAKSIKKSLESFGYSVCGLAGSGKKSIEMVKKKKPDLILMDIVLKGEMDGIEAAEIIASRFDIPVVYLTAFADEETLKRAKVTDPAGYMIKPFRERELQIIVEIALYKHKAERERRKQSEILEALVKERTRDLEKTYEEQKSLQMQLFQSQKMEAIGTLADGIAHDFNNLLHSIIGFSNLLKRRLNSDTKERHYIDNVIIAAKRGGDLTNRLLTFTRKTKVEEKVIDIKDIVEESLKLLGPTIPATIKIKTHVPSRPCYIFADPAQINQVIMNICINASHAMPEGGELLISLVTAYKKTGLSALDNKCNCTVPAVQLQIKDTGNGIEESIHSRVFDPFFTTKPVGTGSGLGLSIVYGIVRNQGGKIAFQSKPGEGTTFCICFPMVNKRTKRESADSEQKTTFNGQKVALIDDEEQIVEMTSSYLKELELEVVSFTSSLKAFEEVSASPEEFDIIITDQIMPDMTGLELSKKIKSIRKDIPIIICSGYSELITPGQSREAGISKLLIKPIDMDDLAVAIGRALGKKMENRKNS